MSDDYADDGELDDELSDDSGPVVSIEIAGLSVYTHHGITAAEQEVGQRLEIDIRLDVEECDATLTDRLEDTIDYAAVSQSVWLIAQDRSFATLERLAAAIADQLLADYGPEAVWIKITKPEPPMPLATKGVSVELWKEPE